MNMESDSPSWLNREFVESLYATKDDRVSVDEVRVSAAVGKGENYGSQLHRVAFHHRRGCCVDERRLVVKSFPAAELIQQLLTQCGTFERETRMYQETLPALNKILSDADVSKAPLCAQSYKTTRANTIVMDDLTDQGFKMAERRKGLDLAHSLLAVRQIARFHASSVVLRMREPASVDCYTESYYTPARRDVVASIMEPGVKALCAQVSTWPGFERFAAKIEECLNVDNIISFMAPKPDELLVLNHGDVWVNNLLFSYDHRKVPTEMRLVDFQETRLASPALDLQYFLHTSPEEDVRLHHWSRLLETYRCEFVDVLRRSGVGVPTEVATADALTTKLRDKDLYGLLAVATILPIVLVEPDDVPDFDHWSEGEGERMYTSQNFSRVFKMMLRRFEENGLFSP